MKRVVLFAFLTFLFLTTFGSFWSWLFPSVEEGILVGGKIDSVNPVISPNAKFTLYTFMDGNMNPLVLMDNEKKSKKTYSSTMKSMNISGTTIFMEPDWDSDSHNFVYTDVSKMDIILADLDEIKQKIDFKGQKDLMPNIDSGNVVFVSAHNRKFYLVKWTSKGYLELVKDSNFKMYPKFLGKKILYIQYNLGKTSLIILENNKFSEIELDDGYQISRIYPCSCGKVLIAANKDKFREDLFIYNMSDGGIKRVAEDIVGSAVFWIGDKIFGYVRKAERDAVVLIHDGKSTKRVFVKGHPIEWITASNKNWIAAAIFNPEEVVTNIYLFKMGD